MTQPPAQPLSTRTRPSGRRLVSLTVAPLLLVGGLLVAPTAGADATVPVTATFAFSGGGAETFRVPAGVTSVTVSAEGGRGGLGLGERGTGGRGALVRATLGVTAGEALQVYVAGDAGVGYGGNGWSYGGTSDPGGSGGGSSAVLRDSGEALVVAGGGGGAPEATGGACSWVGSGGDAGADGPSAPACLGPGIELGGGGGGRAGTSSDGGQAGAGGAVVDASGCEEGNLRAGQPGQYAGQYNGESNGTTSNDGGGGGGAGWRGAGSGGSGAGCSAGESFYQAGSGGGGGGSSYTSPAATDAQVGVGDHVLGANGSVTITYLRSATPTRLEVAPATASAPAGTGVAYTVTAFDGSTSLGDVTGSSTFSIAPASGGSATGAACTGSTCSATAVGTYTVTARANGLQASASLTITAAAASTLTALSGGGQSATVGGAFSNPLVVVATDAYGNPVPGAPVTFAVDATSTGAASLTGGGQSVTRTTGTNGQASTTVTAGSAAGPVTVAATSGNALPTAFVVTVKAATAARGDLAVDLAGPSTLARGGSTTLTVTVRNAGPSSSGRFAVAVALPRQLTPTAYAGGTRYGSVVVFRGSGLAAGSRATFRVTVTATGRGSRGWAGFVVGTTTDPSQANNVAYRPITVT